MSAWPPRKPFGLFRKILQLLTPVPVPAPVPASDRSSQEEALRKCVQGWLQIVGPTNAVDFGSRLSLDPGRIYPVFVGMEVRGMLMRGVFENPPTEQEREIEWCERRILQRIHRLTLSTLRKQVEAVAPAVYMRWLLGWQHLAPQTQLSGEEGLLEALTRLEGFEAPAIEWEQSLLPARVANYDPRWLDQLCLSGAVGWGRVSPHPAWSAGDGSAPRRIHPTNASPITFFVRDSADWLPYALAEQCVDEKKLQRAFSPEALKVRETLRRRGASFAEDLQRVLGFNREQTQCALWELAAAGLASSDGFDQLRAMIDPHRKQALQTSTKKARSTAGRWCLFTAEVHGVSDVLEQARRTDAALESAAHMLLTRYGVLFRDLLVRESNAPKWRDLLGVLRRLEARGVVCGGRFVTGFGGEQFALPEAVESLRASRHHETQQTIVAAAADPVNLAGIVVSGLRVPSVPGRSVSF